MKKALVLVLVFGIWACRPEDQKTESIDADAVRDARQSLPAELVMHLDSGNAAYRRQDYEGARKHYQAATVVDEKQPAGWFGLYMVAKATGDTAAARQYLESAQKMVPGATLIHPEQ